MNKSRIKPMIALFLFLGFLSPIHSLAQTAAASPAAKDLAVKIDAEMAKFTKPGEPGGAMIIKKDGKVLLRKGYGTADLELGVLIEPDMIFRLGSITKQFTAVAVLMLEEQGKLSVKDSITKFLPNFPTQGKTITIEHLLTHTSGVKSYTDLPAWMPLWRKDMTVQDIIDLFRDQSLEFEPGEHWKYSNSGYILLGAIIEKASGETYENFVQKRIFDALGMKSSCYGSSTRIIPRRIPGYSADRAGFVNASYISMTQPYAAGSLLSSVDDLATWNEALLSGKLIKRENLERAWTPYRLKDGTSAGYGYGWAIGKYEGRRVIEHGGGIMGFSTYAMIFPEDGLFIAFLTNSEIGGRSPEPYTVKAADLVLGITPSTPKPATIAEKDLAPLVAVYRDWEATEITISRQGTKLFAQRSGGAKNEIVTISPLEFAMTAALARIIFEKDGSGAVTGLRIFQRSGPERKFVRTNKPLPDERKAVALDPAIYDRYAGEYELTPDFKLYVTREKDKIMSQATGQGKVEIFPESETKFFVKVIDAQIEFVLDAGGKVTGLMLFQGGQKIPAKKIK